MKKQKAIWIVVLIVAIISVGLYLTKGLMREDTKEEESPVVVLTSMEDITYVQYKNKEGTITLTKAEGVWKCEENTELVLASGYVYEKVAELATIEGTLVADAVKTECGLEEATYSLTMKNSNQEVRLVLGVDEEEHCYAMLEGKNEIYEISKNVIEILKLNADSFVEPDEILDGEDDAVGDDLDEEITPDATLQETSEGDDPTEDKPIEDIP